MVGSIQFGGIASGLDTNAIVAALVQAESFTINQYQSNKSEAQAKLNLFGTFEGLVDDLHDKVGEFSDLAGLLKNSVDLSTEGFATVSSSGGTAVGSYSLEVLSLAETSRWSTEGVSDPNAALDFDDVAFTLGGTGYDVDLTDVSSLNDLSDAINEQFSDVASATVINTGTSTNPSYKMVLESKDSGSDGDISDFSIVSTSFAIDVEGEISDGTDAQILLNGLSITRSTNDFSDVVEGLSITTTATTTEPVTFTVGVDTEGVTAALQEFVDAYNDVITFINDQNEYSEEGGAGGALFGDSALSSVSSALTGALFNTSVVDSTSSFGSLGLLGIDLNTDGTLSIDSSTLNEKLTEDPELFADFFVDTDGFDNGDAEEGTSAYYQDTSADTGLMTLIDKALDQLLDSQSILIDSGDGPESFTVKGLFALRKETLEDQISDLDDRIDDAEDSLAIYEENLILQFAALEQTLGGLNAQQQFLAGFQFPTIG
ncbi:MAG: flagellar filament capping protein FliD [Planctomycetota bacterium]|jgi:flagellar hook-associated protein 2